MSFGTPRYGLTRTLSDTSLEDAVPRVTAALATQGFGVLTTIDLAATLDKKLGVQVPPYTILGACNPRYAHQAVQAEPGIGLLLPCNVVVAQEGDDVVVSAVDPEAMFSVVGRPEVAPIATEVKQLLSAALEAI